jgi:hypothetical protein
LQLECVKVLDAVNRKKTLEEEFPTVIWYSAEQLNKREHVLFSPLKEKTIDIQKSVKDLERCWVVLAHAQKRLRADEPDWITAEDHLTSAVQGLIYMCDQCMKLTVNLDNA